MRSAARYAALLVVLVASPAAAAEEASVLDIFRKTLQVYAECDYYQDAAESEITIDGLGDHGPTRSHFTTAFRRDLGFKLEYDPGEFDHFVYWTDGRRAKSRAAAGGRSTDYEHLSESLLSANLSVDGVGALVVSLVYAKQLHGEQDSLKLFGIGLHGLKDLCRVADQSLAGRPCYCIAAKSGDSQCVYWIDQATHLIRRVEEVSASPVGEGQLRRVTTFTPRTDLSVGPEAVGWK